MSYTLNEAVKAIGKGKTTIHRAIESGKVSASKLDSGACATAPSALRRVFQIETEQHTISYDTKPQLEHLASDW